MTWVMHGKCPHYSDWKWDCPTKDSYIFSAFLTAVKFVNTELTNFYN